MPTAGKKKVTACVQLVLGVSANMSLLWHMLDVKRMGHLFVPDAVSCTSKHKVGPVNLRKRKLRVTEF